MANMAVMLCEKDPAFSHVFEDFFIRYSSQWENTFAHRDPYANIYARLLEKDLVDWDVLKTHKLKFHQWINLLICVNRDTFRRILQDPIRGHGESLVPSEDMELGEILFLKELYDREERHGKLKHDKYGIFTRLYMPILEKKREELRQGRVALRPSPFYTKEYTVNTVVRFLFDNLEGGGDDIMKRLHENILFLCREYPQSIMESIDRYKKVAGSSEMIRDILTKNIDRFLALDIMRKNTTRPHVFDFVVDNLKKEDVSWFLQTFWGRLSDKFFFPYDKEFMFYGSTPTKCERLIQFVLEHPDPDKVERVRAILKQWIEDAPSDQHITKKFRVDPSTKRKVVSVVHEPSHLKSICWVLRKFTGSIPEDIHRIYKVSLQPEILTNDQRQTIKELFTDDMLRRCNIEKQVVQTQQPT
jgi:hypothetical protein